MPDPITVIARNEFIATDNKIHSDDVAQKFGFTGALVPGVTVFAYLTQPLAQHYGARWMENSEARLKLIKPAYDRHPVTVTLEEEGYCATVRAHDEQGALLAIVELNLKPEYENLLTDVSRSTEAHENPVRQTIGWDNVVPGQTFSPLHNTPTFTESTACAGFCADDAPLYRTQGYTEHGNPVLHPLHYARLTNRAFTRIWHMPAWIHTGTTFRFHKPLLIGETLTMSTTVLDKWRKKGHEIAELALQFHTSNELRIEARHTAIFKPA